MDDRNDELSVDLDDLTPEMIRTMVKLDDRFGPVPGPMEPMHETNLRVLARFGLADEAERRLTDRGRRLVDEGEIG